MKSERKAMSDVELIEEQSHVEALPKGKDYMELNGMMIMGESRGNDLCLVVIAWRVGGGRRGKWMVDDALIGQTTFLMVPQEQRGKIHDNAFIGNRQDPREWEGNIQILERPDAVIWQTENRQLISRPPYWEYTGEHMGVACNLTLGGLGKATRSYGPWSDLTTSLRAGYEQHCWVEGTITVNGKEYVLENGYGIHDRITFGETWDHMKNMRVPYSYIWSMSDTLQFYVWNHPDSGVSFGRVYIDDQQIPFGRGEIVLDELEWWVDPMTAMRIPSRWHVNMNSAGGLLDVTMAVGGRAIYCVMTRGGYTLRYAFILHANGRFFHPDGHSIPIRDMMTYMEWGRSVMPLEGGNPER